MGFAFIWIVGKHGISLKQNWLLTRKQIQSYFHEYYVYSHPLFVYSLVGLISEVFDRWLLQYFSGSVQQGFYGLSYQIGAICFLFTGAMTPLLTREFAIAFGESDLTKMAALFRRHIPLLYSISAYFACFIAVQADRITYLFAGQQFQQAALAVAIMSFYPIHQTYGQLSGSVFYATGQTGLYRNIGVSFLLLGLPVTFILIAPTRMMGLNAGATGLAIKMVLIQFLAVNVQLYFNARLLKLNYWKYAGHQIVSVGCLLALALFSSFLIEQIISGGNMVLKFVLAGFVYTVVVSCLAYYLPIIFGLSKQDIRSVFLLVKKIRE